MARLIQIVPEVAPEIGGVAAYAELLAAALCDHGFATQFVAPRKPDRPRRPDLIEVEPHPEALAGALAEIGAAGIDCADLDSSAREQPLPVLLHYVGYGYAPRGCPGWLVRGLELAGERLPLHLVVLFHETWVGGPPWTHRFWLLPRQIALVRRLAELGRWCLASAPAAAAAVQRLAPQGAERCEALPTPSTFGEPDRAVWPGERRPQVVVLGLPPVRGRTHTLGRQALLRFCERAGIEEVHDIGPPLAQPPAPLPGRRLVVHGVLPAAEVGRFLLESRALAVYYPRQAAAKSTLIAAGMASGCPVLNCAELLPADDGLSDFRPATWDGRDWRQAGEQAHALYRARRSWRAVATHLAVRLR